MTAPKQAILLIYGDDGTALGYDIDTPEVTIETRRDPGCNCWFTPCGCEPQPSTHTFTLTASRYRMIRGTNPDQRPELEGDEP